MVRVETDPEAVVPNFTFDESKGITENLEAFFVHLADYNKEFSAHLKTKLLPLVAAGFDRTEFNKGVVELLDDESQSEDEQP